MIHYNKAGTVSGLVKSCKILILFIESFINHHRNPALYGVPDLLEAENHATIANVHHKAVQEILKMSELENLKPGLVWVRQIFNKYPTKQQFSCWVVAKVEGKFPFMHASVVFIPEESEGNLPGTTTIDDPEKWQFGPYLDIPSKYYVEVRPDKEYGKK